MKNNQDLQPTAHQETTLLESTEDSSLPPLTGIKKVEIWGGRLAMTGLTITAIAIAVRTIH